MTTTITTWTEQQIAAGNLSPGARGMAPADAADQHNAANALTPDDPDYLYAPGQAQATARDVFAVVGIEVPDTRRVALTDTDATGMRTFLHVVNTSQVVYACEQHRLATGDTIDA